MIRLSSIQEVMKLYTGKRKEVGMRKEEESSSNGDQFTSYHRLVAIGLLYFSRSRRLKHNTFQSITSNDIKSIC